MEPDAVHRGLDRVMEGGAFFAGISAFIVLAVRGWRTYWNVVAFAAVTFATAFMVGVKEEDFARGLYVGLIAAPQGALAFALLNRRALKGSSSVAMAVERWTAVVALAFMTGAVAWAAVGSPRARLIVSVLWSTAVLASAAAGVRAGRRGRWGPD